eukprot:TRINITY_DN26953_c0_g1_i1.p2 TRINITY_DN26953_c0_g1~~TRINITY_DN26953_c0_g1_i1.p2  ORF type:complete len:313 (-),score=89.84 TRINITY_DN26953_c0_g1_i1:978-1916(-)
MMQFDLGLTSLKRAGEVKMQGPPVKAKMETPAPAPASAAAVVGTPPTPAPSKAASVGKQTGKQQQQREAAGAGAGQVRNVLRDLSILALQNAKDCTMLKATVVHTIIFNVQMADPLVTNVKAVTAAYSKANKSMTDTEKASRCSPHIHVWNALVSTCGQMAKSNKMDGFMADFEKYHAKIKEAAANMVSRHEGAETMSEQQAIINIIAEQVKVARVSRCWDAANNKLELSIVEGSESRHIQRIITELLVKVANAEVKIGMAPRTNAERKIQDFLGKAKEAAEVGQAGSSSNKTPTCGPSGSLGMRRLGAAAL